MKTFDEIRQELLTLLKPHSGTPIYQRANQWVFDKTGVKMPQFLGDKSIPVETKVGTLEELAEILRTNSYDKLPTAASGQAQTPGAPASAPVKAPAPALKKPEVVPAPAPEPEPTPDVTEEEDPEVAAANAEAARLAAEAAAAAAKAKAAAAAKPKVIGLTEEQVRKIIKEELDRAVASAVDTRLALLFSTIVEGLKG